LRHEQGTTRRAGPRRGGPGVPVHVGASDDTAWSRRCPNARTCRPPRAHAPDFLPSKPPPRRSDSLMSRGRCPAGLRDRQACTHYWLLAGPDRSHESRNRRTDPADDRNSHASHFEFERERERETVGPACATGCMQVSRWIIGRRCASETGRYGDPSQHNDLARMACDR